MLSLNAIAKASTRKVQQSMGKNHAGGGGGAKRCQIMVMKYVSVSIDTIGFKSESTIIVVLN